MTRGKISKPKRVTHILAIIAGLFAGTVWLVQGVAPMNYLKLFAAVCMFLLVIVKGIAPLLNADQHRP